MGAEAIDAEFTTLVAIVEQPIGTDRASFERLLWRQLQQLHNTRRFALEQVLQQ